MANVNDQSQLTVRHFTPLVALMSGYAFLMIAGGMNSLIIPIRGDAEGFSAYSLGLLGTSWAVGFILGSIYVPHLVSKVGHIRIFAVMASLATLAVIASILVIHPLVWVPLRAAAGFCFAGAAMIVESWLNEQTKSSTRGRVFGIYTMVNLTATTVGQMLLVTGDTNGAIFFMMAAMFYTLALIPPALSTQTKPRPLRKVSFSFTEVWNNSPVAVVSVILIGVSNSAFGALGAVFGQRLDLGVAAVATFMSVAILAGALVQIPVGYLSDRFDRRAVLVGLTFVALLVDIFFLTAETFNLTMVIIAGAVFGGAIYSLPPVAMAHANDRASKDRYVQTSSSLLMFFGAGAIVGPFIAGIFISGFGERGLFLTTLLSHLILILYAIWRIFVRGQKAVPRSEKTRFTRMEPGRVILVAPILSNDDFGFDEDEEEVIPVISDSVRQAFSKKKSSDDRKGLQEGRSADDTHGGW